MALEKAQQLKEALTKSRQVLVVFRHDSGDGLAAALALKKLLAKLGNEAEIVKIGRVSCRERV